MTWHDQIREARERAKLSQAELAGKVGCSQATINKIENEKPQSSKFLLEIINQLGLSTAEFPPDAFGGAQNLASVERLIKNTHKTKTSPSKYRKEIPSYWAIDLNLEEQIPLYAPNLIVDEMYLVENVVAGTLKRPPFLEDVSGAYAISTDDEEMIPEISPGDILYINPHKVITHGDICVFYSTGNDESEETLMQIKKYMAQTETDWEVLVHNPIERQNLSKSIWSVRHRVVAKIFR